MQRGKNTKKSLLTRHVVRTRIRTCAHTNLMPYILGVHTWYDEICACNNTCTRRMFWDPGIIWYRQYKAIWMHAVAGFSTLYCIPGMPVGFACSNASTRKRFYPQARLLDVQEGASANTERYVVGKLSARWFQRRPFWHRHY